MIKTNCQKETYHYKPWNTEAFLLKSKDKRHARHHHIIKHCFRNCGYWASLVAQMVKNLPAMQETLVLIPGSVRSPGERISYSLQYSWASLLAQMLKNPPAMWETWVWCLGWEGPLEKGTDTHFSIISWRISWTEEPWTYY